MNNRPFTVACIPAYNEEKSIAKVLVKTIPHVDGVIICDDGSTDMSARIAERMGAKVIRHERNMGYGASLSTLFRAALDDGADIIVTLDADGQHDPDQIPRLLEPILSGAADVVIGSRFLGSGGEGDSVPKYREGGIKAITRLAQMGADNKITDAQSGFRAYTRRALELLIPTETGMGASTEILIKARKNNLRIYEVPATVTYHEESSTKNPVAHGLDVVLSTIRHLSIMRPLIFYGIPGAIFLVMGLVFWLLVLQTFAVTRQLVISLTLIALAGTLFGLVLLTTAVMLWVLVSVVRERA